MAGPCSNTTTISLSSEATAIANCGKFDGDIWVDQSFSGELSLNGLEQLDGSLIAQGATQLTSISGDQLVSASGGLQLGNLTVLSTLNFPLLSNAFWIWLIGLPTLQTYSFAAGGLTVTGELYIQNTQFSHLNGFDLTALNSLLITNNAYLEVINFDSLINVTGNLEVYSNGNSVTLSFANLIYAYTLTVWNVTSIYIPSLQLNDGAMTISDSQLAEFKAPNLTLVNTLIFQNNPNLASFVLPSLKDISRGLRITNNSKLASIAGFDALENIGADLQLSGNFDSVSLPALSHVSSDVNVTTTSNNRSICYFFNEIHSRGIIEGQVFCQVDGKNVTDFPTSSSNAPSNSGGSSSSTQDTVKGGGRGLSGGAIAGIVIGAIGGLALIAAIAWIVLRRKAKNKKITARDNNTGTKPPPGHHELPRGKHYETAEMYSDPRDVNEMRGQEIRIAPGMHELPRAQTPVHMVGSQSPGGWADTRAEMGSNSASTYVPSSEDHYTNWQPHMMSEQEALEGFGAVGPGHQDHQSHQNSRHY